MKYLQLLKLLLLCLPTWSFSQMQVLSSSAQSTRASIDLAAGKLTYTASAESTAARITGLQITIENGDIVFSYQLPSLEEDHFFEIVPVIKLDDRQLLLATNEFRGDLGRPLAPGSKRIIWLNPLERYVNLVGRLEVQLTANEWGELVLPYDCALGEPTFTGKQKMPFLLAAGVGVAGIGLGQLFKKQSEDSYAQYQDAKTLADAQPLYDDANSQNHTYLLMTWTGAGILAADAVLYLIRNGKYKRNLKNYNTYCKSQTIGFQPVVELQGGGGPAGGRVGFKMTVSINDGR